MINNQDCSIFSLYVTDLEGSYFYDSHGAYHQPAFRVQTVDSTGAGDVFHGAAVYAVLQGFSGPQMALFAGAAAALKCLQVGGKKGIPNVQQIKNFLLARGENSDFIPQAARTEWFPEFSKLKKYNRKENRYEITRHDGHDDACFLLIVA